MVIAAMLSLFIILCLVTYRSVVNGDIGEILNIRSNQDMQNGTDRLAYKWSFMIQDPLCYMAVTLLDSTIVSKYNQFTILRKH